MLFARDGFNVIATANTRDRGVNEMSAALKRRFNFETVPPIADLSEEMALVQRETDRLLERAGVPRDAAARDVIELLVTTFHELRARQDRRRQGAGAADDGHEHRRGGSRRPMPRASTPITTATARCGRSTSLQHLVGSALKDDPDDLKKLQHYFDHVVKGRRRDGLWHGLL